MKLVILIFTEEASRRLRLILAKIFLTELNPKAGPLDREILSDDEIS